jgi:YHS domain-containing protein
MSSFTDALHERVEAAAAARSERHQANIAQMADRTRREALFDRVAGEVFRGVVRPMIEEVARVFANCTVEHLKTPTGYLSRCVLARTDRYPASTELDIGIGLAEGTTGLLTYRLGIIPELMTFTRADSWTFELGAAELEEIRVRVAEWLLRFTETYLRLETEPAYQDWQTHIDPVCGMGVSGAAAAHVLKHAHRKIYFCSEECRLRFEAQPALYLTGAAPLS